MVIGSLTILINQESARVLRQCNLRAKSQRFNFTLTNDFNAILMISAHTACRPATARLFNIVSYLNALAQARAPCARVSKEFTMQPKFKATAVASLANYAPHEMLMADQPRPLVAQCKAGAWQAVVTSQGISVTLPGAPGCYAKAMRNPTVAQAHAAGAQWLAALANATPLAACKATGLRHYPTQHRLNAGLQIWPTK